MNIANLRKLIAGLPDEISSVQFGAIEVELEDLLAQQRLADEAELQAIQEREKALRVKLGLNAQQVRQAPPPVRPPANRKPSAELIEPQASDEAGFGADTDSGGGGRVSADYEDNSNNAFLADLAEIRQRNVERRSRNEH